MSFLIIEIVGLLLLSALCGAGLMYWWLRRQFEDVTAEFALLQQQRATAGALPSSFDSDSKRTPAPQPALSGAELELIRTTLSSIERKLSSHAELSVDLETVISRIGTVERKVDALAPSLASLEARLLETLERPRPSEDLVLPEPELEPDPPEPALPPVEMPEPEPTLPEDANTLVDEPSPAPEPEQPPAEPAVIMETVRREEGRNLLTRAAFGEPDDIEIIKGIGPKLRELLHSIGVYYFWQIAAWTEDDIAFVDGLLESFQGRIERDQWVSQAIELAASPESAKPPPGEGPRAIPARQP